MKHDDDTKVDCKRKLLAPLSTPNPYADDQMVSYGWSVTAESNIIPLGLSLRFQAEAAVAGLDHKVSFADQRNRYGLIMDIARSAYTEALWAASQAGRFLGPDGKVYRVIEAPELTNEVFTELGIEADGQEGGLGTPKVV